MPIQLPDDLAGGAGGGGSVFVAASNAFANSGAAYVCDGTNDEVQIQAAINDLASTGGSVVLSDGVFNIQSGITINTRGITLRGQGPSYLTVGSERGTVLVVPLGSSDFRVITTSPAAPEASWTVLEDFAIHDVRSNAALVEPVIRLSAHSAWLSRLNVRTGNANADQDAVHIMNGATVKVDQCVLTGGSAIRLEDTGLGYPYLSTITNNYVSGRAGGGGFAIEFIGTEGATPTTAEAFITIANNTSDGNNGGFFRGTYGLTGLSILNNQIAYDTKGIVLVDCVDTIVAGNTIWEPTGPALSLTRCDGILVNNNWFGYVSQNGIEVIATKNCVIAGNILNGVSEATNDAWSGIILDGDSDANLIYGNMVRVRFGVSNKPRYGIRVNTAACTDNLIYGNDIKGVSAALGNEFSDAGTGTITTSANRT